MFLFLFGKSQKLFPFEKWPKKKKKKNRKKKKNNNTKQQEMLQYVIKFALVVYEQHNFRHKLTFDLIVTLTLGVGT